MSTLSLIDPKPLGAFIEYTLKPIVEDVKDLVDLLEKNGIDPKYLGRYAWKLYIFDRVISLLTSVIVTGLICWTALKLI